MNLGKSFTFELKMNTTTRIQLHKKEKAILSGQPFTNEFYFSIEVLKRVRYIRIVHR